MTGYRVTVVPGDGELLWQNLRGLLNLDRVCNKLKKDRSKAGWELDDHGSNLGV